MEEEGVTRCHLAMDEVQALLQFLDPARIGTDLFAGQDAVIDAADVVGAAQHLEAAVLPGGGVEGLLALPSAQPSPIQPSLTQPPSAKPSSMAA